MRLAEFILTNMEDILAEWEVFAATLLPAAAGMTQLALRGHAQQILEAVGKDLATPQAREAQSKKAKGHAHEVAAAPATAAQTHAVLRVRSGFDINQLVAEYRALRASVIRLWIDARPLDEPGLEDMIRFNEAIDQAVAESVGHFHKTVERAGPPIDPSTASQMYDPLQRGSAEDHSPDSRTSLGLGLFIVRQLVDAHGGTVDVHSDEGQTTFVVRLPRRDSVHCPERSQFTYDRSWPVSDSRKPFAGPRQATQSTR